MGLENLQKQRKCQRKYLHLKVSLKPSRQKITALCYNKIQKILLGGTLWLAKSLMLKLLY